MNTKLGLGILVATVLVFTGTAMAKGPKGLGEVKKAGGAGLAKQSKNVVKQGAKAKAGRKQISKGMSQGQGGLQGIQRNRNQGKIVNPKHKVNALKGAINIKKGQAKVKQAQKKGAKKAKPLPVKKPKLNDKQALEAAGF